MDLPKARLRGLAREIVGVLLALAGVVLTVVTVTQADDALAWYAACGVALVWVGTALMLRRREDLEPPDLGERGP